MKGQEAQKIKSILATYKERISNRAREISFPGFEKVPLYDVGVFFIKGFRKGSMVTRASAIAFNMLLAILPAIIFLFTLIPFIPVENLSGELLRFFENILPANVFGMMESTLVSVLTEKSGVLLMIMFFSTLLFSSNGVHALISAFNVTYHSFHSHNWLTQRWVSIILVVLVALLLTIAVGLIIFSKLAIQKLVALGIVEVNFTFYLLNTGKWLITIIMIYFSISFLYYFIPARKSKWKFFSAGSTLASVGFIIASLGFTYFVNHFGQYNRFYGSIGTIIVILLWMYFNSISLLIGFELNVSIKTANFLKEHGEQTPEEDVLYKEDH